MPRDLLSGDVKKPRDLLAANGPSAEAMAFDPGVEGYSPETGMVERSKAASAAYGLADTAGLGFADEIASTIVAPFTDKTRDEVLSEMRGNQRKAQEDNPGSYLAGQVGGGVAQAAVGGIGPATMRTGVSTLGRMALGSAVDSAAIGGAYGIGSGETAKDRAIGGLAGAGTGFVAGAAAPYISRVAESLFRRFVTPFASNAARQDAVDVLAREGVGVTAGQRTGNKALRYAESELGGRRAEDMIERQGEQFTQAALRRIGEDAPRATPEVLDNAYARIGQQFDDLAARNDIIPDQQFGADIQSAISDYGRLTPEHSRAPIIQETLADLSGALQRNGRLQGDVYQSLRSRLGRAARNTKDPELGSAIRGINDALDDAMERSIQTRNPADLGAWQNVRNQYRNFLAIESAATRAGEDAAQGVISPSALRGATVTKHGRRNYARGRGDFAELARAGEAILKPLPNSGTAGRLRAQSLAAAAPTAIGAGYGGMQGGDAQSVLAGGAAGYMLPKVAGALLMSRIGQGAIGNQLLAGEMSPAVRALMARAISSPVTPQAVEMLR